METSRILHNRVCTGNYPIRDNEQYILNDCMRKTIEINGDVGHVKQLELGDVVGEGSFGRVYRAIASVAFVWDQYNPFDVAVKIVKLSHDEKDLASMDLEVKYSYEMGKLGLSPKLYDAFKYLHDKRYYQIIIMQYFRYDGKEAILHAKKKQRIEIIKKMIHLVRKMLNNGLYCVDIKLRNFVVSENFKEVRIIDFGPDWCTTHKPIQMPKEEIFHLLLFQLYSDIRGKNLIVEKTLKPIFCNYVPRNLPKLLENYYNNENLLLQWYLSKLGIRGELAIEHAKNLYNFCNPNNKITEANTPWLKKMRKSFMDMFHISIPQMLRKLKFWESGDVDTITKIRTKSRHYNSLYNSPYPVSESIHPSRIRKMQSKLIKHLEKRKNRRSRKRT